MPRTIFTEDHEDFRALARSFFEKECAPHTAQWERDGIVDREVWRKAGSIGLLGWEAPERFGGTGIRDYRYNAVLTEEFIGAGCAGFGYALHNDVMPPYLLDLTTEEQQRRWLSGWVSGELITAVAMSEPGAGSDLKAIGSTAVRDGDHYILNGSKTYITNGILSDLVVVVAKTDPAAGHRGISLLAVERDMPGFTRGRNLAKAGMHAQDTAELFFSDVRVPATNLIGQENRGFYHLMTGLPQERLGCAVHSVAVMTRALSLTEEFVRTRRVFGTPLGSLQNTRFVLATVATTLSAARAYVDRAIELHIAGELSNTEAAALKLWTSERHGEVVDACLQLFGGAGYMDEYEISRLWRDSRVQRIYAGTSEVMREIIGRELNLAP
ncbi:acyl-CoA dehydrogenase family protein [Nocardia alni]|uniref:acyl-CoA dehydrogenase family protein n=1 Tax=Nocardia alni TaxID=2815723 RepID=UPI001C22585E|nr:acyl-CoA dehydrogenase family protein [Nocardia alni]